MNVQRLLAMELAETQVLMQYGPEGDGRNLERYCRNCSKRFLTVDAEFSGLEKDEGGGESSSTSAGKGSRPETVADAEPKASEKRSGGGEPPKPVQDFNYGEGESKKSGETLNRPEPDGIVLSSDKYDPSWSHYKTIVRSRNQLDSDTRLFTAETITDKIKSSIESSKKLQSRYEEGSPTWREFQKAIDEKKALLEAFQPENESDKPDTTGVFSE